MILILTINSDFDFDFDFVWVDAQQTFYLKNENRLKMVPKELVQMSKITLSLKKKEIFFV